MSLKMKTNILAIMILALSLFLFFFLIQPCLTQAVKNGEDLTAVQKNSAELDARIKNLQEFKPRYEQEIKPKLQESKNLFIDPQNPVPFISLMEESAGKDGLAIDISSARIFSVEKTDGEMWPSLNFRISLKGPASGILKFMERMNSLPYLIEIHGLNVAKDDQAEPEIKIPAESKKTAGQAYLPGKNNVRAVFNLKIYTK